MQVGGGCGTLRSRISSKIKGEHEPAKVVHKTIAGLRSRRHLPRQRCAARIIRMVVTTTAEKMRGSFLWRARCFKAYFSVEICLAALFGSAAAFGASFTATLDRDTVAVGESATLTLTFEGGDLESVSGLNIPNLHVEGRGTSRNFSFADGKASTTLVQTYVLTPTQPGDYAIPPIQARIGGQTLSSEALKLKVVKPGSAATDAASGDNLAFVKLFVPRKEIFIGEVITVEVQIY